MNESAAERVEETTNSNQVTLEVKTADKDNSFSHNLAITTEGNFTTRYDNHINITNQKVSQKAKPKLPKSGMKRVQSKKDMVKQNEQKTSMIKEDVETHYVESIKVTFENKEEATDKEKIATLETEFKQMKSYIKELSEKIKNIEALNQGKSESALEISTSKKLLLTEKFIPYVNEQSVYTSITNKILNKSSKNTYWCIGGGIFLSLIFVAYIIISI